MIIIFIYCIGFIPFIVGKFKPKVLFVISQTITTLALITICIYSFINELSHDSKPNTASSDISAESSAPTAFLKKNDPESYVNGTMLEESNVNDQSLIKVVLLMSILGINISHPPFCIKQFHSSIHQNYYFQHQSNF